MREESGSEEDSGEPVEWEDVYLRARDAPGVGVGRART